MAGGAAVRGSVGLGRGVRMGRGCILGGGMRVGDGARIDGYCAARGRASVGERSWICPFCNLGTGPHRLDRLEGPRAGPAAAVGPDNAVRECAGIDRPVLGRTPAGSGCFVLAHSRPHRGRTVGGGVTLASAPVLGGRTEVHPHANLGFLAAVHRHCRTGRYAAIGMQGPAVRDVPPSALISRQRSAGVDREGVGRGGLARGEIGGGN